MLSPLLCFLLLTPVASFFNLKQQLVKGEFQAHYKRGDHQENGVILHYTGLHYTRHYGKARRNTGKEYPAPRNFHETSMDTIKENDVISKTGSVAGRKQKTLDRDCKLQDCKKIFPVQNTEEVFSVQNTNTEEEKLCNWMCLFSILLPILAFMSF